MLLSRSPSCNFQSRKKILSVHQPAIFVATIWQERERKENRSLLLMMIGLQLTLSSLLLILLLIIGWPAPLMGKWVGPAEQRLGGAGENEEVRSWEMPEAQDLTVAHLPKSIWMMTFDKIKSEIVGRIKKGKRNDQPKKNRGISNEKNSELLRFRKRGWMLPPSKASPLAINR